MNVERLTINEYLVISVCQVYWWADFFCGRVSLVFAWINDERLTLNDEGPSVSPLEGEVKTLCVSLGGRSKDEGLGGVMNDERLAMNDERRMMSGDRRR